MNTRARRKWPTWRTWLIVAGVLAGGTYIYLFVSAVISPEMPPLTGANQVAMESLRVHGQHGSKLGWQFGADSAQTSIDGGQTTYRGVRDATYYNHGKPAYRLSADSVSLDARSQNYSASGNVHVWALTGAQPRDIRADDVNWNQPLQTLTCPGPVKIQYKNTHFEGNDISVNFRDGTFRTEMTSITYHKKK